MKRTFRITRIALALLIVLLLGTIPSRQICRAGCGPNDSYCTSKCCLGTVVIQNVTGCTGVGAMCTTKYGSIYGVSCPSPGCQYVHVDHKCNSSCQLVSDTRVTGCCMSGPAPTDVPPSATNTPIPTPTATPTVTPSPTPSPTPTVVPLAAGLTARKSSLVLMATRLGLPTQTLDGVISGGTAPYGILIHVARPDGTGITYTATGASFSFGATQAGDTNFGTTQQGIWRAWLTVTDGGGRTATSNTVTWSVVFYPVHQTP